MRYSYLWRDEQRRGMEEGSKERPCAVVLAVLQGDGERRVVVAPITHSPPAADSGAIEVPAAVAARLGLDDDRQWIVTHEVNLFSWPGPDIRPVPNRHPETIAYGQLPHGLASQLIERVREHVRQRTGVTVTRTE